MKKYFKLIAKKSLSLAMALLMVLSCWVWVAPPMEAQAANSPEEGYYQVRVYGSILKEADEVSSQQWTVTYKTNNGLGSEGSTRITLPNKYDLRSTQSNVVLAEAWVPGWPTVGHVSINAKTTGCNEAAPRVEWTWQVYDNVNKVWKNLRQIEVSNFTASYDHDLNSEDTPDPTATKIRNSSGTVESKTMPTIPAIGATNAVNVGFTAANIYDQYGVRMITLSSSYTIAGDNAGMTPYNKDEHGVWLSGTTVYANANVQKALPNKTGTQKLYVIAEGSGLKANIAEVTLNYPSYTVTVDPDGSITGLGATMNMSPNGTRTGKWDITGPYSATTDNYPNGTATKEGYAFKGFWTTKQPTTGDAGTNASEATFAVPVSSDDFVNVYGGTAGAEYVEKDGKKYFNAGTQWDGATHKEILGTKTFYGWWVPKDIVVKFYDVDGTFLGTKTTKYGAKPGEDWYPNPKDGYNAGAYDYQGFAKQWRDITGAVIAEGTYTFGALETLSLTPIYTNKTYSDKYQVNFVNPADGSNISPNSKEYAYRYILNDTDIPTVEVPAVLKNDPGYSYEFTGWTSQAPASGNYHKVAKDDTAITENTDWVVREEIKYYPIFRSTVKEYLVNFNYTDSTGTAKTETLTVPYGSAIATPAVVNRTYAKGGYGYTLEGWDYQTNTGSTVMLGADATLVFDNTKVFITTGNLAPNGTPIVFTANYDEGKPTPYTVTFKFKDAEGKDRVITDEVYHGYAITQETVDRIAVPAQYDDGAALYTFSNLWKVTEGTSDKAEYTKDEFTSFNPTSHVTFEAIYGEGVPFHTVTYVDGDASYSERILAGKNVPAWMVTAADGTLTEYVPTKAGTETGDYKFEGWFDEEQTDKDFAQTNGTKYTTESTVNSDLVLYPQFKFEPFKFTIKFMNFDGTVQLAIAEVEAGQSFEAAFVEAQRAAQHRDADETYEYEFIGWDHNVPDSFLCEGKDVTYTALYKPNYKYYEAKWYNSVDVMSGDPIATTKHTYNSSVYAPAVNLELPEAEAGKTTVFAGWKYLKDGVETDYVRGMKITADMSFYATYTSVNKAVTLTTVVGTTETKYTVEYGQKANIGNPADGYVDETNHNHFVGWYADADYDVEFDIANTTLTADTTIYAKFETAAHSKTMKELVSAPTYYAKGSEIKWCACNREETDETVEIPMLTDTVAPTGTIYLGGHSWSSEGAAANATDNDPISIFVNEKADIVITSNDKGDVNNAYNPSGIGKGVANIRAFAFPAETVLTAENYGAAQSLAVDVYTNNTTDLNNNANFSIKLGRFSVADLTEAGEVQYNEDGSVKFKSLEDGESYIIYYYVNDKAGNQLNRKVRTAKFTYDNSAPEIAITGDSNAATAGEGTVSYCGKAVIKGIENGSTVTVNGNEVELTTAGASGTTAYTINGAGNYIITVTDKAGNTASKKIIVTDGHDEVTTSKAVTCTEDGYEKVICAVCAKVIKNETIESEGHKYGEEVEVDPTCTEDGYTVKTCSVCYDEVVTPGKEKTGHTYNKDENNEIVYEVVTASTCKVKGKAAAECTVCGEGKLEKELELDTENGHKYGATKVLKATCTQDGEEYQNCKYCYAKKTVKVLPKLNHVDTGRYTKVTTAATCYSEGVETTYCKGCDTVMGTAPVAMLAHTLVLVKYEDNENDDVENYPNGYMQYECKATGCTHTEGKTAITVKATYTVTFKGAGAEGADVVITKTEGESIEANAVADQKKASDNEYNYTFAGWKAASGKVVKLPVKVTADETYTAEFTATKRIYTHKFTVGESTFATIIGTYESLDKKPVAVPTKDATATASYEFAGWQKAGDTTGAIVTDFTMTEDATFVAKFTEKSIQYTVTFVNGTTSVKSEKVSYGTTIKWTFEADPTRDATDKVHYNFDGWYLPDGTKYDAEKGFKVTEDIKVTAKFNAEDHTFGEKVTETTAATCTAPGVGTVECSACKATKEVAISALGHDLGDAIYDDQTGEYVRTCKRECGHAERTKNSFTVTFLNDNGTALDFLTVKAGDSATYSKKDSEGKVIVPTKEATKEETFEFVGWKLKGASVEDDEAFGLYELETVFSNIQADATYVAVYDSSPREYTVSYMDADNNILESYTLGYGAAIPAYKGDTSMIVKAPDGKYHYAFNKWVASQGSTETVIGETILKPDFTRTAHTMEDNGNSTDPTCTKPGGLTMECKYCDYSYVVEGSVPATGHDWDYENANTVEQPTLEKDGYQLVPCKNGCGEEKTVILPAIGTTIEITVVDSDSNPVVGATVVLKLDGVEKYKAVTDENGVATFKVAKGDYTYSVYADGKELISDQDAAEGNNSVNVSTKEECSCSCHRANFWGMIFRLFQKFIKLFTGKINCCSCPDPMYK